jgi:hypothetical protein
MGTLQKATLAVIGLIWVGYGLFFSTIFVEKYPEWAPRTYAMGAGAGFVVLLLHFGILRLFRSKAACIGMIVAKVLAIGITFSAGFWGFALSVMSTDSGMENAAEGAWFTVPFCMAIPAIPATIAAFVGAAVGQVIANNAARAAKVAPPAAG